MSRPALPFLAQIHPANFSCDSQRQFGSKLDLPRVFALPKPRLDVRLDIRVECVIRGKAFPRDDEGFYYFAPDLVGNSHDSHHCDRWMTHQTILDLGRANAIA